MLKYILFFNVTVCTTGAKWISRIHESLVYYLSAEWVCEIQVIEYISAYQKFEQWIILHLHQRLQ